MSGTTFDSILASSAYQSAKRQFLESLTKELSQISAPRPPRTNQKSSYEELVKKVGALRGRDLFYPWIGSGAGNGPFIELADGSVKYDLITGIGVNFFGHGNLELLEAELDSTWCDVMQGNLGPGPEYGDLMKALLECAGERSRLKHVWLTSCGATANETALKIIRQKKAPATGIIAFKDCFAGRTTALQEITDNAAYRQGQPTYGEVFYLPFYDFRSSASPGEQAIAAIELFRKELSARPGKYATFEFEIVQGEGGFHVAPREFLLPIVLEAKKAGLAIWVDEIQTFGRTGEIFCYQHLGMDELVDVVTVAKLLQVGAALWTAEYNPKPGLVSGTFAGSSAGLRAGCKALEILRNRMCGPNGQTRRLEKMIADEIKRIKDGPLGKHVVDATLFGGMVAFTIFDGSLEKTKKFLFKLWDLGAAAFYCGHGPYRVRMLPPLAAMNESHCREVFALVERALKEVA